MDDRRFDSLVKAFATGASRRTVFKGLLGLGGAAVVGSAVQEDGVDAARRPTPTPKPVTCPGQQTLQGGVCKCVSPPAPGTVNCGPDCCNPTGVGPAYSECCDNACCYGHCYGEELCCPTGRTFCEATQECCPAEAPYCCGEAGCCANPCCADDVCCEGATSKCCPGGVCIPAGGCCDVSDCGSGNCWSCVDHICVSDQAKCAGCLDCVQGSCATNDNNCDDGYVCNTNVCNPNGSCAPPVIDCRNPGCACFASNSCYEASCNQQTGQCEEVAACSQDCCADNNPDGGCLSNGTCSSDGHVAGLTAQIGSCYYDIFCQDNCCATWPTPNSEFYCETEGPAAGTCVAPF